MCFSLVHQFSYEFRSMVFTDHLIPAYEEQKTPVRDRMSKTAFNLYVRLGTAWASLGRAGSIYLLMAIAATGMVETFRNLPVDQIQPLCEHILNPGSEFSNSVSLVISLMLRKVEM